MPLSEWTEEARAAFRDFAARRIPFNQVLGVEVTGLSEGFARLEIPFREELIGDPFKRAIHGGVMSALIDATGGIAVFTMIEPGSERVSTIDLRVDYLRPGEPQRLACEAHVQRLGARVASVDMRVFHPTSSDRLVAAGRGVYNVRRSKSGSTGAQG